MKEETFENKGIAQNYPAQTHTASFGEDVTVHGAKKIKDLKDIDYIFHYTKRESAYKILENDQFKFSCFRTLQDPMENKMIVSLSGFSENELQQELEESVKYDEILKNTQVLCFCKNSELEPNCMKSRMWSQYGDEYKGMCFVFSKKEFKQFLEERYSKDYFIFDKDVSYRSFKEIKRPCGFKNAYEYIQKYYEYLFFTKDKDYQEENEYRFVLVPRDHKFSSIITLEEFKRMSFFKSVVIGQKNNPVFSLCRQDIFKFYIYPPLIRTLQKIEISTNSVYLAD
jgi:hypothetical protein